MNIISYPERFLWSEILKRPTLNHDALRETVAAILSRIQTEGDYAVMYYEEQFDKVKLSSLQVSEQEFAEAEKQVSIELKAAIMLAFNNIRTFHMAQKFEGKNLLAKSRSN